MTKFGNFEYLGFFLSIFAFQHLMEKLQIHFPKVDLKLKYPLFPSSKPKELTKHTWLSFVKTNIFKQLHPKVQSHSSVDKFVCSQAKKLSATHLPISSGVSSIPASISHQPFPKTIEFYDFLLVIC